MMQPDFSIIVPVYNTPGEILTKTLESIIQSFRCSPQDKVKKIEIILVDDHSVALPVEFDIELVKGIELCQLRHAENLGRSVARNSGIEAAQGAFLSFLDSDDELMPDYFKVIEEALSMDFGDKMDFFTFAYYINSFEVLRQILPFANKLETYTDSKYFHISSCMIRRASLGDLRFTPGLHAGEDICFFRDLISARSGIHTNMAITKYNFDYKNYGPYRPGWMRYLKYSFKHLIAKKILKGPLTSIVE
jgi:glycosyltransferase involved in cell wall biosynthesis